MEIKSISKKSPNKEKVHSLVNSMKCKEWLILILLNLFQNFEEKEIFLPWLEWLSGLSTAREPKGCWLDS